MTSCKMTVAGSLAGTDYIGTIIHNLCNISAPLYIIYASSVFTLKTSFAKSNVSTGELNAANPVVLLPNYYC